MLIIIIVIIIIVIIIIVIIIIIVPKVDRLHRPPRGRRGHSFLLYQAARMSRSHLLPSQLTTPPGFY